MQYYIEAEENPEVAEVKAKNEKAAKSAWDHIKNAIKAIRMAIGRLLSRVAEVFSKASMEKQTKEAYEAYKTLQSASDNAGSIDSQIELADYYKDTIIPAMENLRKICDKLEGETASEYWPFPTYGELLFAVR